VRHARRGVVIDLSHTAQPVVDVGVGGIGILRRQQLPAVIILELQRADERLPIEPAFFDQAVQVVVVKLADPPAVLSC
jgi:hypothetical protein